MNIKNKFNSITAKTLTYLIIFSITILLFLWFSQLIFLRVFYERYQLKKIDYIASAISKEELNELNLESIAFENNICIEYYNNKESIIYNGRISGCILMSSSKVVNSYKNALKNGRGKINVLELITPDNKTKSVLYSITLDNGYIFLNSPLEDLNSTTMALRGQLIYITFLVIFLAILISYFVSKRITNPIINITNKAKRIGKEQIYFSNSGIRELDELSDTLNYAQEELITIENLRRDLMANVSHDLKTPLTMIKAYAELIKDISYKDKKKREEHLDIIVKETDRLTTLVNDILDLSTLQANAEILKIEEFDLAKEIKEITKRYKTIREDYKINIEIMRRMLVRADKNKISQVIYNLINNAINYTGIDKTITVRATSKKKSYLIEIIDTGKGIKEDELVYIWDKYYKSDKNHKRNVVGTGLGLSIVKTILERHGFIYGVHSVVGNGSTFYFEINKK